ncbi:MAG: hypothetical protein ACE5GJ_00210 [Gemmatimonadota bacterium]
MVSSTPLRIVRLLPLLAMLFLAPAAFPTVGAAQGSGDGSGIRVGVSFGGTSTVGLVVEFFDGTHAVEVSAGTWSFRDLGATVVAKEYFGAGAVRPFVGLGLWLVTAAPRQPSEQWGTAGVLHAPIGFDWRMRSHHYAGIQLNVNRALWVRRTDPEDDLPMNRRLVPLPEAYYRWRN